MTREEIIENARQNTLKDMLIALDKVSKWNKLYIKLLNDYDALTSMQEIIKKPLAGATKANDFHIQTQTHSNTLEGQTQ